VRWAIIGTGIIAETMVQTLHSLPDMRITAVVSRTPSRAAAFAQRHGIEHTFGSVDHLDPSTVDVAYVASTNDRHVADAVTCLEAGIPVLLEKPVALDTAGALRIVETARENGVFLMEAMWMHFQPYWRALETLIAEGAVGPVRSITADLGFPAVADPTRRWFSADQGGGALLDVGIYPVTFATLLAGEPIVVAAVATVAPSGVDDQVAMSMVHDHGIVSWLGCSFVSDSADEAVVAGPDGRIRVTSRFHQSGGLEVWRAGELIASHDLSYEGTGYEFEVEEVRRCLEAGLLESPTHPLDTTLMVMRTLDRVREAAAVPT